MSVKKVIRKQIEKTVAKELEKRLSLSGWKILEKDQNYFSKKYNEEISWGFNFSFYNRKPYSLFFKVYIECTKYSKIIDELMSSQGVEFLGKVGFMSSKTPKDKSIIHISHLSEVPNFVGKIINMINISEEEFWLHYSNVENTISEFRHKNHVYWPFSTLSHFASHMVAYGIDNEDKETIKFTIDRANELLATNIFERDRNFIENIIKPFSESMEDNKPQKI